MVVDTVDTVVDTVDTVDTVVDTNQDLISHSFDGTEANREPDHLLIDWKPLFIKSFLIADQRLRM